MEPTSSAPTSRAEPNDASGATQDEAEELLERVASSPGLSISVEALTTASRSLEQRGKEARAIDLLRRAHAGRASWPEGTWLLARMLLQRGDDHEADELLAVLERDRTLGSEAILARAEIAERAGDEAVALARYERVLALDLGNVRARTRAERLRRASLEPRGVGATLLAGDGALARGRYRIVRELGRGGAGTVFAAEDIQTSRSVALKIYHSVRSRGERDRLLSEARVAASLEHPGVVRILDLDETLGAIAMELLNRGSVKSAMTDGFSPERLASLAKSFADALAFVHAAGVVHRDLKPSNLLFRADGRVVLTDFGVARRVGEKPPEPEGTLAYMAPEQREAQAVATNADVFSMGRILLEIVDCTRERGPSVSRIRDVAIKLAARAASERPASAIEVVPLLQRC